MTEHVVQDVMAMSFPKFSILQIHGKIKCCSEKKTSCNCHGETQHCRETALRLTRLLHAVNLAITVTATTVTTVTIRSRGMRGMIGGRFTTKRRATARPAFRVRFGLVFLGLGRKILRLRFAIKGGRKGKEDQGDRRQHQTDKVHGWDLHIVLFFHAKQAKVACEPSHEHVAQIPNREAQAQTNQFDDVGAHRVSKLKHHSTCCS
mmetsp:Transcript_12054/g.26636  ORF Transcript_12054/g.26636 Transcript_12054/m.26636 type:complete len:205 (+) Transcript_12054:776-1390(+)